MGGEALTAEEMGEMHAALRHQASPSLTSKVGRSSISFAPEVTEAKLTGRPVRSRAGT